MTKQKDKWAVEPMGKEQTKSFAGSMLKMVAVGLAGGIAMIAMAKKVGDTLLLEDSREDLHDALDENTDDEDAERESEEE